MNNYDTVVRTLDDPATLDPVFGGKASVLARLRQSGILVPAGVALSSRIYLTAALSCPALAGLPTDGSLPELMRQHLLSTDLPQHAESELRRLLAGIPSSRSGWVVRSSAVGEDSANDSFAGQLDTVIGVSDDGSSILSVECR